MTFDPIMLQSNRGGPRNSNAAEEMKGATAAPRRLSREGFMVTTTIIADPMRVRLRAALHEIYGDRLERAILYGSRARGDAHPGSDYDVAVFLHGMTDLGVELHRLAYLESAIIDATGEIMHAMPHRAGSYNERTPLMREIRQEGVEL